MPPNTPLLIKKIPSWKYFSKYFHSQMCQWLSEWKWRAMILQSHGLEWIGGYSKSRVRSTVGRGERLWLECFSEQFPYHVQGNSLLEEGSQGHTVPSLEMPLPVDLPGKMHYFPEVKQRWQKDILSNMGGSVSTSFFLFLPLRKNIIPGKKGEKLKTSRFKNITTA